jgi:putative ABC transport system permease protein
MRLPVSYNVKSLVQRKLRSLLTAGGIALAIFLSVMMIGLSKGLVASTLNSGSPRNVLLLSKGSESMEFSALDPMVYNLLKNDTLLEQADGEPLISPEAILNSTMILPGVVTETEPRGILRGVWPVAAKVHDRFAISEGRWPERGFEVAVGKLVATKLGVPKEALSVGKSINIEGRDWAIVGEFESPGTVMEAEIWGNLDDVLVAAKRDDFSVVTMRAASEASAKSMLEGLALRTDVQVAGSIESDYFAAQATQLKPVQAVAIALTVILVFGAVMAGMNTMFTSIVGRAREMGVLLVLGYKRRAVLLSFILESILLSLAGGIVGAACGLLLNGMPMKMPMGAFKFVVDPSTLALGVGLGVFIGLFGALLPVARVARMPIVQSLKAT